MRLFRLLFTVAFILAVIIGTTALTGTAVQAGDFSASLKTQSGLVQVLSKGTSVWKNVRTTETIKAGDQIRTAGNGLAQLTTATGIEVSIYPGSIIELKELSTITPNGQTFILAQYVGALFNNFKRKAGPNDLLEVALPAAGLKVKGTQYWSVLTPSLEIAVFGQDNEVQVLGADGKQYVTNKDNFARVVLKVEGTPASCTIDYLSKNVTSSLVTTLDKTDAIEAVRAYLKASLVGRDTPSYREYLRTLIGLDKDKNDLGTILKALDAYDPSKAKISDFLSDYRNFLGDTSKPELKSPIAPATCGNGKKDAGETVETCPSDFIVGSRCGDGVCELKAADGSAEGPDNCPLDCVPKAGLDFAAACTSAVIGPRPTQTPDGSGGRPKPTKIPPTGTITPTPSL